MINLDKLAKCLAIVSSVSLLNGAEGMRTDELPATGEANQIADSKQKIAENLWDRKFVLDGAGVSTEREDEINHDGSGKKRFGNYHLTVAMKYFPAILPPFLGFVSKKSEEAFIRKQIENDLFWSGATPTNQVPIYYSEQLELDMQMTCDLRQKYDVPFSGGEDMDFVPKMNVLFKIIFSLYEKNNNITDITFKGFHRDYFLNYMKLYILLTGDEKAKYKWRRGNLVSKGSRAANSKRKGVAKDVFDKIKSGELCIRFDQIRICDVLDVVDIYKINNQYISTLKGEHTENDFSPKTLSLIGDSYLFSGIDLVDYFSSYYNYEEDTQPLWIKSTIGSFFYYKKEGEIDKNYKICQQRLEIQSANKYLEDMVDKYILDSKENWIKLQQCCLKAIQYVPAYINTGLLGELSQNDEENLKRLKELILPTTEIIYFGKPNIGNRLFYSYGIIHNLAMAPKCDPGIQKMSLEQYKKRQAELNKHREDWNKYIEKNSSELRSREFIFSITNEIIQKYHKLSEKIRAAKDWTAEDVIFGLDKLLEQLNEATKDTFLSEHDRISWNKAIYPWDFICLPLDSFPYVEGREGFPPTNQRYKYEYSIKSVIYYVTYHLMLKTYSQLITSNEIGKNINLNKNWELGEFVTEVKNVLTASLDYVNDAEIVFEGFDKYYEIYGTDLTSNENKNKANIDEILDYIFDFKKGLQMERIIDFSDFLTTKLPLKGDVDRFIAGVVGLVRGVWVEQCFSNPVYISIPLEDGSPENKPLENK